jgi:hypothetical protein
MATLKNRGEPLTETDAGLQKADPRPNVNLGRIEGTLCNRILLGTWIPQHSRKKVLRT